MTTLMEDAECMPSSPVARPADAHLSERDSSENAPMATDPGGESDDDEAESDSRQ